MPTVGCLWMHSSTPQKSPHQHLLKHRQRQKCAWSPEVAAAMRDNKQALHSWIAAGRPQPSHPLAQERRRTKRALRAALRQAEAQKRITLYRSIIEASADNIKLFYHLIKMQRKTPGIHHGMQLQVDGLLMSDPDRVLQAWTDHFKGLATPMRNSESSTPHHRLVYQDGLVIEHLCALDAEPQPVTGAEVVQGLRRLNTGKAMDIHQLTAEHLKMAASACLPHITALMNAILQQRYIPSALQEGYILPVHKKGRIPYTQLHVCCICR